MILIGLFFITESELEKHAVHMSCQMSITIITLAIFFMVLYQLKLGKYIAMILAAVTWIIMITIKRRFFVLK